MPHRNTALCVKYIAWVFLFVEKRGPTTRAIGTEAL